MFESLTDKLSQALRNLRGVGRLTEENMAEALAEVRTALLDADVNVAVARDFVERVRTQCAGQDVLKGVTPGQQIVKIINDELARLLGGGEAALGAARPLKILLVGLHGSGKTTSTAKLGRLLKKRGYRPLLVACDVQRPAAIDQLEILAQREELVYDTPHTSITAFPGMKERTIFLHGFSKAFAMTGFRIGYACGPAELIEAMMKVHQYSMLCAPILAQEAAIEALARGEDSVKAMRDNYHRRRDLVVRRLNAAGLACHSPNGAFYAFPSVAATGLNERDFAYGLLEAEKVAVVPGTAFGESGRGFVRASFAASYEHLTEACDRIERYVQGLRR